jgi:aryl-alcohol dehydrogenase-like predicted oxidoreductase
LASALPAWAHGTIGTADVCAPSWAGRSERDITYLNHWLDQGYAVLASDYQGLGTPGGHPYLTTRPEAYSERLIAGILKERKKHGRSVPLVATKIGRRLPKQDAALFTYANLAPFVEDSLKALEVDALDLVQLHCPPIETYYRPEAFEAMDRLQREGKIRFHGVSVEKVEEGLKALGYPGVVSVQIVYNMFRQRPNDLFLDQARQRKVAVIARIPLASGLLTGKFKSDSKFDASDHRQFNRHGEAFDVGETFAGVPYETGLAAVGEVRPLVPKGTTMAQFALRWILMNEAISVVIPGAKNAEQARGNIGAAALPPLSPDTMARIRSIYETSIKPSVHHRW